MYRENACAFYMYTEIEETTDDILILIISY